MPKRPTSEHIEEMLAPAIDFKSLSNDVRFIPEIKTRMLLTLPLKLIEIYDKNPRRDTNPNYLQIKESIANDGLNQPLVITRRSLDQKFIIFKGGNTRLTALQELFKETGSRKFQFVDCAYIPWTGEESDAIIGHLQENQMRKSLCFIDRACGLAKAIEFLKMESGVDDLSLRNCQRLLTEKGYSINLNTLSIMIYAHEVIEPHLPYSLSKKMGRPQLQKLRNLEETSRKVSSEFGIEKNIHRDLFFNTLNSYSGSSWIHDEYRRNLELSIAQTAMTTIHDIALRIDGYINLNDEPLKPPPQKRDEINSEEKLYQWPDRCTPKVQNSGVYSVYTQKKPSNMHFLSACKKAPKDKNAAKADKNSPRVIKPTNFPEYDFSSSAFYQHETKLKELKQQAFSIAWNVSKHYKFNVHPDSKRKIVVDTGYWGIGYLVTDFPPSLKNTGHNQIVIRDATWWVLLELCDIHWAIESARPLTAKLVSGGDMLPYVRTGNPKTLYSSARQHMKCSYPFLGLFNICTRNLDENSWNQLSKLLDIYRSIHQIAIEKNIHLFKISK